MGKTRLNITVDQEIKAQMELIKDSYGGFSGLIEKAVILFLKQPIDPYDDDVNAYRASLASDDAINIDEIDWGTEK